MKKNVDPCRLQGRVFISASKSDGQRALIAAALATGVSHIRSLGNSDDERAMLSSIRKMGAIVTKKTDGDCQIVGTRHFPTEMTFHCGESGLGLRLLAGVCACQNGRYTIHGKGSILRRKHLFFETHFPKWGVNVRLQDGFLPLQITGVIRPGVLQVDGSQSSQYISGLLMGLPLLKGNSILEISNLVSGNYVDMTLNTMRAFGVKIECIEGGRLEIDGNQEYVPTQYTVEGDWSSASYWLVAAALGHPIRVSGLDVSSRQADRQLLDVLEAAGCIVSIGKEGVAVQPVKLKPFDFDARDCPDLFPALVVLAAYCKGISTISGVKRLVNKESNRGRVLQSEFGKLGLKIDLNGDVMSIEGTGTLSGGDTNSHHDHRIAMSLAIAATRATNAVSIENAEAVAKSYPDFWKDFGQLSG